MMDSKILTPDERTRMHVVLDELLDRKDTSCFILLACALGAEGVDHVDAVYGRFPETKAIAALLNGLEKMFAHMGTPKTLLMARIMRHDLETLLKPDFPDDTDRQAVCAKTAEGPTWH